MIEYNINDIIEGTITNIRPYGALMIFENGTRGFLHISQITNSFIKDIFRFLKFQSSRSVRKKKTNISVTTIKKYRSIKI